MTLETLFNDMQRQRLLAAIDGRYSCRNYAAPPSTADWGALSYAAQRYELPGARLVLTKVSERMFTGTIFNMGLIKGCTAVAAVIADGGVKRSRIHAGILGEALCLEATAMGLGSCWIGGTYKRKMLDVSLKESETVLAVIALGVPAGERGEINRRRKPLAKICDGDMSLWTEELRDAAKAVQQAPSALNLQPWVMKLASDRFIIDAPERSQLDLGIALCHAELALREPHVWRFRQTRRDPAAWITPKK